MSFFTSLPLSPVSIALLSVTAAAAALYLLYRVALPRPLPGIPYKTASAGRLLGDFPDALEFEKKANELFAYFDPFVREFGSPVVQFLTPFSRPWVIVSDYRETRDILTRRTREFDRAKIFADTVRPLLPKFHVVMDSGEEWRAHRQLLAETMSTEFLHNNVAPELQGTVQDLIRLWTEKARLANGRPFNVMADVLKELTEAIWTATWGSESGSTKAQLDMLAGLNKISTSNDPDGPLVFPETKDPDAFTAIRTLNDSFSIPLKAPAFRVFVFAMALKFVPSLVHAQNQIRALINRRLKTAGGRLTDPNQVKEHTQSYGGVKTALDVVVQKEIAMATKAGRPPVLYTQAIQDELLGFLMAGSDTSATVISWCLKHLTANQDMQSRLRSSLREHFGSDKPTAKALANTEIPYLEAVIAETHRVSPGSGVLNRISTVDTQILGYPIPKGTDVFFLLQGPGFIAPAIPVDDSKRSPSSRDDKLNDIAWDEAGIEVFQPDRWLTKNADGTEVYNPRAGPNLPFSAGPRGCFGQKLAHLSLKIHIAFIVSNFELLPLPPGLSSMRPGGTRITRQPEDCYVRLKAL